MKNYIEFDQDDKKLWIGLGAAALIYIIAFSLYGGSFFKQIERAIFFVLEDILPGYVIYKLFLSNLGFSDNKITDRVLISFALSLVTMVVPFFLLKYLRPYEANTDEKTWDMLNDTFVTLVLLVFVIGIAFGVKYYQNKKKGIA